MTTKVSVLKWALLGVLGHAIFLLLLGAMGLLLLNPDFLFGHPMHVAYLGIGTLVLSGAYLIVDALMPGRIPGISVF